MDDGFALVQAFHSTALNVRGVDAVFGNAPLNESFPIAQHLVSDFGSILWPWVTQYRLKASAANVCP